MGSFFCGEGYLKGWTVSGSLWLTGGVIYFASEGREQKNGRNPLMTGITAISLSGNRGALFFQKLVKTGQNFGAEWSGNGWEWAKKRKKWAGFNRVLNAG